MYYDLNHFRITIPDDDFEEVYDFIKRKHNISDSAGGAPFQAIVEVDGDKIRGAALLKALPLDWLTYETTSAVKVYHLWYLQHSVEMGKPAKACGFTVPQLRMQFDAWARAEAAKDGDVLREEILGMYRIRW